MVSCINCNDNCMITDQRTAADKVGQTIRHNRTGRGPLSCSPAPCLMICTFHYSGQKCSTHRVPTKSLLRKLSWLFLPSISCFVCFLKWHILTDDWEIFSKLDTTWLELDQSRPYCDHRLPNEIMQCLLLQSYISLSFTDWPTHQSCHSPPFRTLSDFHWRHFRGESFSPDHPTVTLNKITITITNTIKIMSTNQIPPYSLYSLFYFFQFFFLLKFQNVKILFFLNK